MRHLQYSLLSEVSPEQPENALSPMLVTDAGIVIEVRDLQPEKAVRSILVTVSGILNEVRLEQPENVPSPGSSVPSNSGT